MNHILDIKKHTKMFTIITIVCSILIGSYILKGRFTEQDADWSLLTIPQWSSGPNTACWPGGVMLCRTVARSWQGVPTFTAFLSEKMSSLAGTDSGRLLFPAVLKHIRHGEALEY